MIGASSNASRMSKVVSFGMSRLGSSSFATKVRSASAKAELVVAASRVGGGRRECRSGVRAPACIAARVDFLVRAHRRGDVRTLREGGVRCGRHLDCALREAADSAFNGQQPRRANGVAQLANDVISGRLLRTIEGHGSPLDCRVISASTHRGEAARTPSNDRTEFI